MCNVNVLNRVSCFFLILSDLESMGVALATLATPWLHPVVTTTRTIQLVPPFDVESRRIEVES